MSKNTKYKSHPPLTKAYEDFFNLITSPKYKVRTIYDHFILKRGIPEPNLTTIVLRIDVDYGFHLSESLAMHLNDRGLQASHYFLTFPEHYYDIWNSKIPSNLIKMEQEVGIHNDHLYNEIKTGNSGISQLKIDIKKLSQLCGKKVKGCVFHGHNKINKTGLSNWDLTKNLKPSFLDLEYHDGLLSNYIKPLSNKWEPKCDFRISDYMGFPASWGWNYVPSYPCKEIIRNTKPNKVIHITIHTHNAFRYWDFWTEKYNEIMPLKDNLVSFVYKKISINFNFFKKWVYEIIKKNRLKFILKNISKFTK